MAYDENIYKTVSDGFRRRREAAKKELSLRRDEIYKKIPKIREIEDNLSATAFSMYQAILNGMDADSAVDKITRADDAMIKEKEELLIKNGYPKDYLTPKYTCDKCKDEGYVGAKMCTCYKNALITEAFSQSNLAALQEQTFDRFDFSYYSKEVSEDALGKSPYEIMQGILKASKAFVENFDKTEDNLLFYGPPGLGKTFLSSCIANELLLRGKTVLYQSANSIFHTLDSMRFGRGVSDKARYGAERLCDVDLLIIDDLGTEYITDFSAGELFRILNTRLLNNQKTIISTNLTIPDLKNAYSERLLSRILGSFTIMRFIGQDIRLQKKYAK